MGHHALELLLLKLGTPAGTVIVSQQAVDLQNVELARLRLQAETDKQQLDGNRRLLWLLVRSYGGRALVTGDLMRKTDWSLATFDTWQDPRGSDLYLTAKLSTDPAVQS